VTARELLRILCKDGWYVDRTNGSHVQLRHPTKSGTVTVPSHKGDLAPGTVASVKRQARMRSDMR